MLTEGHLQGGRKSASAAQSCLGHGLVPGHGPGVGDLCAKEPVSELVKELTGLLNAILKNCMDV